MVIGFSFSLTPLFLFLSLLPLLSSYLLFYCGMECIHIPLIYCLSTSYIGGKSRNSQNSCEAGAQWKRASLMVQLVKNPPAVKETPVRFLGREDSLEKG